MQSLTLTNLISFVISLGLFIMVLFGISLISVAIVSALVVPLTWIWGIFTNQSYDRVCDNSQFIYQLNQIGKWTIVIGIGLAIIYFLL